MNKMLLLLLSFFIGSVALDANAKARVPDNQQEPIEYVEQTALINVDVQHIKRIMYDDIKNDDVIVVRKDELEALINTVIDEKRLPKLPLEAKPVWKQIIESMLQARNWAIKAMPGYYIIPSYSFIEKALIAYIILVYTPGLAQWIVANPVAMVAKWYSKFVMGLSWNFTKAALPWIWSTGKEVVQENLTPEAVGEGINVGIVEAKNLIVAGLQSNATLAENVELGVGYAQKISHIVSPAVVNATADIYQAANNKFGETLPVSYAWIFAFIPKFAH
ncbi:hypothetical protein FJ364_02395 [Candidatus Dependentiae bacterium]|nr:hypothetical protein [Candidatus Dependentiae bacterium]